MLFLCTVGGDTIYLKIDHNAGTPVSAQMLDQIKYQVLRGTLAPGTQVPSVRGLAAELKLNPTTVARVYQQLEAEGVFETRRGRGTFVAPRRATYTPDEQRRRLAPRIRQLVIEAGQLGLDYEELLALVAEEIDRIAPGKGVNHEAAGPQPGKLSPRRARRARRKG